MTFLIAAAGTGGHVFPGLAVGEGLLSLGIPQGDIVYVGGDRLEAEVYPAEGYRFVKVELAGLKRSLTIDNARIPGVVMRARRDIVAEMVASRVDVVLGMGGYVTIPVAMAARKLRLPFFNAEQNAEAGLANRVTARWARATFLSFQETGGLPKGDWVGNPVREPFWEFDRESLRPEGRARYGITGELPIVGVFGGSLGSGLVNEAVARMVSGWQGPPVAVVHLTGERHLETMEGVDAGPDVHWARIGFEERMDLFYAVSDLVVARAGGAVAELTATATPSVLVPGQFGSGGHQTQNARALEKVGAGVVVTEESIGDLPGLVTELIADLTRLRAMADATNAIAKPDAARTIARAMIGAAK